MYQFVHIPKTGGSALQSLFRKEEMIQTGPFHNLRCAYTYYTYIAVVRDPVSRFISIYRFWKYGTKKYNRDHHFTSKFKNFTIKDFIEGFKTDPRMFVYSHTIEDHFRPQVYWVPREFWANTVVVRYQHDLTPSIQKLFEYIGTSSNIEMERKNVSLGAPETLDEIDLAWIHEYFRADFELWDAVNEHPELFKKVI